MRAFRLIPIWSAALSLILGATFLVEAAGDDGPDLSPRARLPEVAHDGPPDSASSDTNQTTESPN